MLKPHVDAFEGKASLENEVFAQIDHAPGEVLSGVVSCLPQNPGPALSSSILGAYISLQTGVAFQIGGLLKLCAIG